MNNEIIQQKNWAQRNWRWALSFVIILVLGVILLFSLTGDHLGDFGQAYADPQLFQGAVDKAQENEAVTNLLGNLEPIDKMAILEGDVGYSNQNKNVSFSVRLKGSNGKAQMSAEAIRKNDLWEYKKITIRIKDSSKNKQTIEVIQ